MGWGVTRARSPLDQLERKGLIARVYGTAKRGKGGSVQWQLIADPDVNLEAHEEHMLLHKIHEVRMRRLEQRIKVLEDLLLEVGSQVERM